MTAPVPWEQLDHAQIYEQTRQGQGAGVSMPAEAMWQRVAEIVEAGEAAMDRAVRRSEGMWEGSAGDGARDGLHMLNSWARDAATDALNTTTAVLQQAEHAGRLRATVPEPYMEQYRQAELIANQNPWDESAQKGFLAAQDERAVRDESAREKMRDYHFHAVENRALMDYWTTPPTVVVEAASAGPAGGGGPAYGGVGTPSGSAIADALNPAAGVAGSGPTGGGTTGTAASGAGVPGAGLPRSGAVGAGPAGPGGVGARGVGTGGAGTGGVGTGGVGTGGVGTGGVGTGGVGARSGIGAAGDARPGPGAAARPGGSTEPNGPGGGAVPAGRRAMPPTAGRVPAPGLTGRDELPPGAGGRGPRSAPTVPSSPVPGGVRTLSPQPTGSPTATPTWRDVVAANRVPGAVPPVVPPGEPAPRTGGGQPGTAAPAAATRPAATGGAGHGMYPPMTGAASGQGGETRRRAPYLIDDTGFFDVEHELYYVEPVIRGTDQER